MEHANGGKAISLIIPSYNDLRILRAIDSVRAFDDGGLVSIVVVDGGSAREVVAQIADCLTDGDVLISEPDCGIFDALNKGLDVARTPYIGWIGSDDALTGEVKAREVVQCLIAADLFVATTVHVQSGIRKRVTYSWPAKFGLVRFGLNNPHFSTFGRSELLKRERFPLSLRGADVEYFLRIFKGSPRIVTSNRVCTLMEEGGFSNSSYRSILKTNVELYSVYRRHVLAPVAGLAVLAKLTYKCLSVLSCRILVRRYAWDLPHAKE